MTKGHSGITKIWFPFSKCKLVGNVSAFIANLLYSTRLKCVKEPFSWQVKYNLTIEF